MRDRKGVDSEGSVGGKDLGGRKGEESIIRMYFMRQESPLNKREKKVLKEKEKNCSAGPRVGGCQQRSSRNQFMSWQAKCMTTEDTVSPIGSWNTRACEFKSVHMLFFNPL